MQSCTDPRKINSFEIQNSMAQLQDEFRNILIAYTNQIETDMLVIHSNSSTPSSSLTKTTANFRTEFHDNIVFTPINPNSSTRSSCITESSADFKTTRDQSIDEGYLEDEISFNGEELGEWSSISYRSSNSIDENDPSEAIYNLRSIAERMISAGYLSECVQVYVSVRKPIVVGNFRRLEIERLGLGDVRWWIQGAKVCVWIQFAREKRLCEQIFEGEGLGTVAKEACLMETVKGPAIQLFNFPRAISTRHRSPMELFMILDLHYALTNLLSDVDVLLGSNSLESIQLQADEVLSRLAEAARRILVEFECAVQNSTRTPLGEIIQPLTRYVLSYILLISDYKETMNELIVSNPSMGSWISVNPIAPEIDFAESENQSPFSLHLIWIIVILQFKLEERSKYYKDASLSHIFLMNNVHFIIQKIKGHPKLHEIIGHECLTKLTLKFRQGMIDYMTSTWVRILYGLRDEGLHGGGGFMMRGRMMTIRKRFKIFNSMFKKVHRVQATWLVPDPQLRKELQISIMGKLIPAYQSFLLRSRWPMVTKKPKYSVHDLQIAVLDFFEGARFNQYKILQSIIEKKHQS